MNTPLSDEMMALLNYANETTEGADSTLGDAVKTLCDGYGKGGGDLPTFYDWLMPEDSHDSAAYIDTGLAVPEDGVEVRVALDFDNLGNNCRYVGFSSGTGWTGDGVLGAMNANLLAVTTKYSTRWCPIANDFFPHHVEYKWHVRTESAEIPFYCDNQVAYNAGGGTDDQCGGNFVVFGSCIAAIGRVYTSQFKCYGVKIWIDGRLSFYGRPASDEGGNGLYDFISGTMKYTARQDRVLVVGND